MKTERISSKNNPLIVRLSKLKEKKYRELEGLFVLDGEKLFLEALRFGAEIEYIVLSEEYYNKSKNIVSDSIDAFGYTDVQVILVPQSVFE